MDQRFYDNRHYNSFPEWAQAKAGARAHAAQSRAAAEPGRDSPEAIKPRAFQQRGIASAKTTGLGMTRAEMSTENAVVLGQAARHRGDPPAVWWMSCGRGGDGNLPGRAPRCLRSEATPLDPGHGGAVRKDRGRRRVGGRRRRGRPFRTNCTPIRSYSASA